MPPPVRRPTNYITLREYDGGGGDRKPPHTSFCNVRVVVRVVRWTLSQQQHRPTDHEEIRLVRMTTRMRARLLDDCVLSLHTLLHCASTTATTTCTTHVFVMLAVVISLSQQQHRPTDHEEIRLCERRPECLLNNCPVVSNVSLRPRRECLGSESGEQCTRRLWVFIFFFCNQFFVCRRSYVRR